MIFSRKNLNGIERIAWDVNEIKMKKSVLEVVENMFSNKTRLSYLLKTKNTRSYNILVKELLAKSSNVSMCAKVHNMQLK